MDTVLEKICPNCKKWDNYHPEEKRCKQCGSLIDKNEIIHEDRKKRGLLPKFNKPKPFLQIKASYPWYLKLLIRIVRPIVYVFMLIISMITWFVVWASA